MRIVVQRVRMARVTVANQVIGEIGKGLLVFLGIAPTDSESEVNYLAAKLSKLRLFSDFNGQMNLSVTEVSGEVLIVSQFTLYADATQGNRPSFMGAARPEIAEPLYLKFVTALGHILKRPIATGQFGADMLVSIENDGPVTLILEK